MANKTIAAKKEKKEKAVASPVNEKELAVVEKRISKAEQYANALVITSDDDERKAVAAVSELNRINDELTDQKEELTKPLNNVLKLIRGRYKQPEEQISNAVRTIKGKLTAYFDKKQAAARKEADRIAAQAAKGTIKPETAVRKMDEIAPVEKNVSTDAGAMQYKKVPVAEITKAVTDLTDAEIVAHARAGYLMWNETAARKAALATGKEGEVLAGVTVTIKTQAANIR